MITTLSYGQNTKKSIFNQKNDTSLNKSFGVFNQENIPEKPTPFNDDELNLDNFDAINQKNNKNTALYSSKNGESTIRLDSLSTVSFSADGITGKLKITYDENGRQTLNIDYQWDAQTAAFVPNYKQERAYNENGNQTLNINYQWDAQTAAFVPNYKTEYTYDENGKTIGSSSFSWNSNIEIFYPIAKTEYDFDEQMRVVSEKSYQLDICNNEKVLINRTEYSYIDGLEGRLVKVYQVTSGVAVFQFERGSFYKNGRLVLNTQSVNPDVYDPITNTHKTEFEYDDNGIITLFTRYTWDTETNNLIPSYKQEYTYDEENYYKQVMYYKWYKGLGLYQPSFKKEYDVIIDTDTKRVREGLFFVFDTNFNQWNTLNEEKYKSYWYYTKTSTLSSKSLNKNTSLIFPNPTSKFLKVILSEELSEPLLEIFDATGKKVLSKELLSDESIDVSALTPALYFYKIKDGKVLKKSGKIIKQ